MNRFQQIFPSSLLSAIALSVAYISFTQQPADAFVFPRIISTLFVILALWGLGRALLGLPDYAKGLSLQEFKSVIPGMIVAFIYVFWLAKALGFYSATALVCLIIISLYDPAPHKSLASWVKRGAITIVFTAVMYLLFSGVLNVYTPKEILFIL